MLRQLGLGAVIAGVWLAGACHSADDTGMPTGQFEQVVHSPGQIPAGPANVDPGLTGSCNSCAPQTFDAYQNYFENVAACRHGSEGLRQRYSKVRNNGLVNRFFGPGRVESGGEPPYLPGCDGDYCDFDCANCWNRFDVEKRFVFSYIHETPYAAATKAGYGSTNGASVGIEFLPWVISDGSNVYVRWGFFTGFQYYNYYGNREFSLRSNETNNLLTVSDGNTYSALIAPTVRWDFDLFGIRMSPNATIGISFDWTQMKRVEPQSFNIRRIDKFKYSAFDAAGFVRLMWDFGINDHWNFGIGGQYRFAPTNVMVDNGELRKHVGLVLTVSRTF